MTKKPKKIASANDCKATGFVTADKFLSTEEDIGVTRKDTEYHQDTPKTYSGRHTIAPQSSQNPNSHKNSQDNSKNYTRTANNQKNLSVKPPLQELRLSIINCMKSGLRPSKIGAKLGVADTAVQYHLSILKKEGIVRKLGYGVWEVLNQPEITKKRTLVSNHIGKKQPESEVQKNIFEYIPDSVRGHAFVYTLQVPKNMRNWTVKKREQYLNRHNIPYKPLKTGGQRLIINECKTILYNKSIVVYDTHSYFAEKAIDTKSTAINSFLKIIKKLERMLHTEFQINNDYKFRVAKQHYALIKNALAKQCDEEGGKLEVRSEADNSLWFLIDNSFNIHEAECVHSKTGLTDTDIVQDWFNSLKEHPITADFIFEAMNGIQVNQASIGDNQAAFATNLDAHTTAIQEIASATNRLTALLEQFIKK